MKVDIYLRERDGNREIRFPWLPETIPYKSGGTIFAEYDIMNRGTVFVPVGYGLGEWSWESVFPGKNRTDTSMLRGTWKDPSHYHNILEDWKKHGTPLHLLVTGYPINADVYLKGYESTASGGFGDLEYSIHLIEDQNITLGAATKSTSESGKRSSRNTTSYTVKPGDTLWSIAREYLGSGSKWETIYNANKEIIESTAKKRWKAAGINRDSQHGHCIFPGTKLTIPK